MKNQKYKRVTTINFRAVNNGTIENVFETLKQYQALGLADEDSSIIYENIIIPAGHYKDIDEMLTCFCGKNDNKTGSVVPRNRQNLFRKEKIAAIDFCVHDDATLENGFDVMKQYRDLGFADEDSNILYKGVSIPAGYCEDYNQVLNIYNGICSGSAVKIVNSLPTSFGLNAVCKVLAHCVQEVEKLNVPMTIKTDTSTHSTTDKVMTKSI